MFGLDPAANAPTIDVSKLPPEPEKKAKKVKAAEPAAETPQPEILEPVVEAAPAVEPASAPKPSPRKDVAKAAPAIVPARQGSIDRERDRKSVVKGKRVSVRVDLGGRRIIKKKKNITQRKTK